MSANSNTHRAELRNTLLSNGYTPLPLSSTGKGCFIPGWSRQDVTTEWLSQYARNADTMNTGLRCDQLAAFDLDILDGPLCEAAEAIVESQCGETDLCRFGRYPKRLLLYRMTGKPPFKSLRTPKYGEHRAELLCGSGRQFVAYGIHPGTGKPYDWSDGPSPLTVRLKKLPKVDYVTAQSCLSAIEQLLDDTGLPIDSPGLAFGHAGRVEHDLTDDFECQVNGAVISWGELKSTLDTGGVFGDIRREHGEFGDSSGIHFYVTQGSGLPALHDFPRDCTHYDCTVSPALAQALPDPHALPANNTFTPDPLAELLENYVYLRDGTVRNINHPMEASELGKFKNSMLHCQVPIVPTPPPSKRQTQPAVEAWLRHPQAMRAQGIELRPDTPDDILTTRGELTYLNAYCPPEHPDSGGETATVLEFLEHLIPNPLERQQFIDWHALKVAHPDWRMHGIVLVTRAYGTGRGIWFQLLGKLFGRDYVCPMAINDLIGGSSQSAYNEYMADSLVLTVPEAHEENENISRWTTRHAAYEKLKLLIEPQPDNVRIKRKYGGIVKAMCYASTLIATNHTDALAIEPGDRRLIVLDCAEIPLRDAPHNLQERMVNWLREPANIGAMQRWLAERATETDYNPFDMPLMTPAKERMIEAGQSDADAVFDYMLENATGDLVTIEQVGAFARRAVLDLGLELPVSADQRKRQLLAVVQKRAKRISTLPKSGIRIGLKQAVRPWIIRNFEQWKSNTDHRQIKAEILRNGTPSDNVLDFPGTKPLK